MRWERLFADLEAQLDEADRQEFDAEVADRTRRERARVRLRDLFEAHHGVVVEAGVAGAGAVRGAIRSVGADWVLLAAATSDTVVPVASLLAVRGLGPQAAVPGSEGVVGSRLTLGHALRGLMRDRADVEAVLVDGSRVAGLVDRVGADHAELVARGDRPGAGTRVVVTFAGLGCLRRPA